MTWSNWHKRAKLNGVIFKTRTAARVACDLVPIERQAPCGRAFEDACGDLLNAGDQLVVAHGRGVGVARRLAFALADVALGEGAAGVAEAGESAGVGRIRHGAAAPK